MMKLIFFNYGLISAIGIATKCFHFWTIDTPYLDGIRSTVAEWHSAGLDWQIKDQKNKTGSF